MGQCQECGATDRKCLCVPLYSTIEEVVQAEIIPALGDHGEDYYDLEGIARETFEWVTPIDDVGMERGDLAGFRQCVSDDEFWESVERHDTKNPQ